MSLEIIKKKKLIEIFPLKENEVFEAEYNLLGFFNTLYKIDQRLKREKIEKLKKYKKNDR